MKLHEDAQGAIGAIATIVAALLGLLAVLGGFIDDVEYFLR